MLQAVTTPPLRTRSERRLVQEGLPPRDAERGVAAIVNALADEGAAHLGRASGAGGARPACAPRARPSITCSSRRLWTASWSAAPWRARSRPTCSFGIGCRTRSPSTATRRWASSPAATSPGTGRRTIATSPAGRAYRFVTRAPAWPPRNRAREVETKSSAELPPPRLLGAFEPCLLGWKSRADIVGGRTESGHRGRDVLSVRDGRRARGRALEARRRPARARPFPPHCGARPRGARARRRGRRGVPRLASATWTCPSTPPATARSGTRTLRNWVEQGREAWASPTPWWGMWHVPEEDLNILPDVSGLDVVDLGCGTGYWCAWFAKLGARPVGLDLSEEQLATARMLQEEHGIEFPLIHASAEDPPLPDGSFDIVFSEFGAAIWCDPYVWIPHAHRLLRPGGRLIFLCHSILDSLCTPDGEEPTGERSSASAARPPEDRLAGAERRGEHRLPPASWGAHRASARHRLRARGASRGLRAGGRPADEVRYYVARGWAQSWPGEEVWVARRTSAE